MKDDNELFSVQAAELSPSVYLGKECEKCRSRIKRLKKRDCRACYVYKVHLHERNLREAFRLHRAGLAIPARIHAMIMPEGKGFPAKLAAELRELGVTEKDYNAPGPRGWCFSYARPLRECPFEASDQVTRQFLQSWCVRLKSDGGRGANGR